MYYILLMSKKIYEQYHPNFRVKFIVDSDASKVIREIRRGSSRSVDVLGPGMDVNMEIRRVKDKLKIPVIIEWVKVDDDPAESDNPYYTKLNIETDRLATC